MQVQNVSKNLTLYNLNINFLSFNLQVFFIYKHPTLV